MPTGTDIMARVGDLLNDEDHIRWTPAELCIWINEAVRAIILAKPSASSASQILTLVAGTLQAVPAPALSLVRLVRNLKTAATSPRIGDKIITPVARDILDAQDPDWHDSSKTPHQKLVRHCVYDEANPREFYVYPGNNGQGIVEAIVATLPTPLAANGDAALPASYSAEIGLPEPYSVPVLDYVLYRCQSKDDTGANAGRAMAHYQQFASAIGLKIQVEGATSVNARK